MDVRVSQRPTRVHRLLAAVLLATLAFGSAADGSRPGGERPATHVALVYSPEDERMVEVAVAIDDALAESHVDGRRLDPQLSSHTTGSEAIAAAARVGDLVVTIGSGAAGRVARARIDTPTLHGFLPQAAWDSLVACCLPDPDRRHALLIDQPLTRQFALLKAVVPDAQRVAVLLGPESRGREPELRHAAGAFGFTLQVGEIDSGDDVGSTLRRIMPGVDALLALPDPSVYNRNTIYAILLSTYGAGIPVIGYSRPMVTAGSTAAAYASTADVGKAIAQRIRTFDESGTLTPTGFGDIYSIAVNDDVARSLRLRVPDVETLRKRLEAAQ